MKQYRLKDNHPTMQKLAKLFALAEELGITITHNAHRAEVTDAQFPNQTFWLEDIEDGGGLDWRVNAAPEIPPVVDYKVTYEK